MASSSHELLCHRIGKLQIWKVISYDLMILLYVLQPISTAYKQMAPPLRACHYFYSLKKNLADMLTLNKWRLSKANRPRHRGGSFRSALMSLLRRAESNSDSYALLLHTRKHTQAYSTLPADPWLEPAALIQQYINHWALSGTAGPQCHAELDSTGINVCNWIQKLIQAKRQLLACWGPEGADTLLQWYAVSVMRPLTSALRPHGPVRCYWSEIRHRENEWGQDGKRVMKTRPVRWSLFLVSPSVSLKQPDSEMENCFLLWE